MSLDPRLILSLVLSIAFYILFPLLLGLWLHRRLGLPWRLFGYGALVFLVFQLLTRVPANFVLERFVLWDLLLSDQRYLIAWGVLAALTAALFEEGGRYLGYRLLWRKDPKTWENALMYGAGHGGLEAMMLVGGMALLSLINILILSQMDPQNLPPGLTSEQFRQVMETISQTAWWTPFLGVAERLMAMVIQIALSVLVLQVFLRRRFLWWWLALGFHFLMDLVVLLKGHLSDLQIEGVVLIFALIGGGVIWALRPRQGRRRA